MKFLLYAGILLISGFLTGCQKKSTDPVSLRIAHYHFYSEKNKFRMPFKHDAGADSINFDGIITTDMVPNGQTMIMTDCGENILWYSSFVRDTFDFLVKKDIRRMIVNDSIDLGFLGCEGQNGFISMDGSIYYWY